MGWSINLVGLTFSNFFQSVTSPEVSKNALDIRYLSFNKALDNVCSVL